MRFSAALLPLLAAAVVHGDSLRDASPSNVAEGRKLGGDGGHHQLHKPPSHLGGEVQKKLATGTLEFDPDKKAKIFQSGPFTVYAVCSFDEDCGRRATSDATLESRRLPCSGSYRLRLDLQIESPSDDLYVFGQGINGGFNEELDMGESIEEEIFEIRENGRRRQTEEAERRLVERGTGNEPGVGAAFTSNHDYIGWSGEECIGTFDTEEGTSGLDAFDPEEDDPVECVIACVFTTVEGKKTPTKW